MTQVPTYLEMFPKYNNWWSQLKVVAQRPATLAAQKILEGKPRYQAVERQTGVPWYVIGLLHMRESNNSFSHWLHNGDTMRHPDGTPAKTVQVPAGRPPNPNASWEEGAVDALQGFKLTQIKDWPVERIAYTAEAFNGWAYTMSYHMPSPYLFGGSSVQQRGKFIRDHVFDPTVWDSQLGVLTTLKTLMGIDSITLCPSMTITEPKVTPAPLTPAPKAGPNLATKPGFWVNLFSFFRRK